MKFVRLLKNNSKNSSLLLLDKKIIKCNIGAKGIGSKLREGDFVTPKGIFTFGNVFFRADKIKKPKTSLKIKSIKKFHYWCSDPKSRYYNKLINRNMNFRCENLYRSDSLYDIILETSFNNTKGVQFLCIARKKIEILQKAVLLLKERI